MSRTFYLLLLLAPHGVLLTSQTRELQVSFIHPEFPVVKIKANCDPSSGRKMILDVYKCPMNASQPYLPVSLKGVCEEEGGTHCLTEDLRGEDCFAISGYFWKEKTLKYTSSELSLANVTFFSREFTVEATSWKQQGNTSVLHLKPVAGIPIYMLKLEDASQNKSGNCSSLVLTGGTEEPFDTIVFTAHWHQQVFPGCTYRVWFRPRTECQKDMIGAKDKELPRLQKLKSWEIRNMVHASDSEFSDELPEAVEEAWMKDQEDIIAEERPVEDNIEESVEEDPMVSGLLRAFIVRPGQENEESHSAALTPASPSPSAALPSASAPPLTSPCDPPLGVPFSSDDEDDEYDFGPLSARPRAKKRTDIPSETGGGGLGNTRKLVQPLAKRPRIPWKKMEEQHHVCPMDFKPTNPGIQVDIPDEFDELAALMLFVPDDFWDTIATESNRYYRQKKKAAVKPDITPAEARTYIGIMILLGLSPPHSLRTPWKRDSTFRNDVISSCMTYSRFNHIHSNFHLVDNSTLPPKDTIAYKTARIAPLLHTLKDRCLTVYKAKTRQLSVDEGSMGWKGNSSMRQYNPNKPHKYHIKSYKLVETSTGYLSNIILHDTTSRTVDEVVLTLLDESPYNKHEGYAVFTDRFYTSPDLFWHLRTVDGYDATGICMSNRHQFPPELKCAKGKSKKGEVHSYIATHGDDNLVAMRWRDAKDVFMLSTEETADLIECDT